MPGKRDRFRKFFGKFKGSSRKPPANADRNQLASPSPGSSVVAVDVGRLTPNLVEGPSAAHSGAHVNTVQASAKGSIASGDAGRYAPTRNEETSAVLTGLPADTTQEAIVASGDAGRSAPIHNEEPSAAQGSSHVTAAPFAAEETVESGGATEAVVSSTKEKGKLASYLGAGAWIAGTVSKLSDAIPPLQLTMDILEVILENASTMEENKNAAKGLCSRIKHLLELVDVERADPSKCHVVALTKSLTRINMELGTIGGSAEGPQAVSAKFKRFIFASENKSRIDEYIASVDRALLDYQVALTHKLYEIKLDEMNKDDRITLNNMKPVSEAMFDASDTRTPCLPGTRVDILHTLEGWAADPTARQLYWLNGHAGSGKSTIAQSLAERLFAQGRLGASYFCSRNSQRASDLKTIFATIAFQLARALNERSAAYRKLLRKTIENQANPDVATYSLSEQLQRLILGPVAESGIETVVIIDALDECVDDKSTSAILDLLSQHATRIPELKVKFFITSRPESHIRSGFRLRPLSDLTDTMVIHKVASSSINQDIQLFFEYKFKRIVTTRSDIDTSQVWPTKEEVDALVTTSAGLFIFASTIVKFLDVRDEDPKARLREVFDFQDSESRAHPADTSSDAYPFRELDSLYMQVLGKTSANNSAKNERRKAILGVIVMAYAPVSIATIVGLLCLGNDEVRSLIRPLHSVLHVPSDDTTPLQLYHKSFADFLVDRHRCSDSQLLIIADDHHRSIALHCLDLMKGGLKKNICGLSRYSMNSDLAPGKLDECVSSALRYSCQYWAKHVTSDHHRDQHFSGAQPQLEYLLTKQMLMWVEVLSLIGDLPSAVHSLVLLKEWLTTLQANYTPRTLLEWVQDGYRLVLLAFDVISLSVSHIYHSALVFAPEQSLVKQAHAADLTVEARLLIGATTEWEGPLRTIETASTPCALEFSHDVSMLAVGGRQSDCCIVHRSTGARICSFKAEFEKLRLLPDSWVTSVSFSADNQLLAMAFDESPFLVLLYDVHTGLTYAQHLNTDYNKLMVAFCPLSHHSPLLLIGPQERTGSNLQLYLWDTSSGTPGDSEGRPNCDRLSLDRVSAWCWLHGDQATPQIALGLSDGSIEIRSVAPSQSPALLVRSDSTLFARHIVSMASSQDGTKIAALSADGELSLFTTQTHQSGARQLTHMLSFPKELCLPSTDELIIPPKLYFVQESNTLVIQKPGKLRAFRLDCSASQAGVEEIGLSDPELHDSFAIAFSPDGQHIAYNHNIASLSTAISSMLQHHKDTLRTVGAPEPERHYPICYCDGQVVITDNSIWDITKHERRYSCGNEIGKMSSAFPVKDDIILSCNQRGDVTLWDLSREQPVIKRWEGVLNHRGLHPKLHVYSYTTSTIRFLSYPQPLGTTEPMDIELWDITSTDTLPVSPPRGSTAGDSGPRLHQIAAGQIPATSNIGSVYHEYLADSNGEEGVFYLEVDCFDRKRYRGFHKWSAAQATVSEPLFEEDGSGPVHIEFEELPYVWEDMSAEYPIAGDGLFRMSEDRRWVLDSRRRKRLWLPPAYASKRPGETFDPGELHCAHGSTFAICGYTSDMRGYLKTLVDFSGVRLDHSVPF